MVAPLIIAGGLMAAGALMQAYQAEQARKATKARLKEIEKMFNEIVPPDLNIKIYDDPDVLKGVPAPYFNTDKITPEAYQVIEKFNPEVAQFIQEKSPEFAKASEEAKTGRKAQLDALAQYQETLRQGFDPQSQILQEQAARKSQGEAQSRIESVLQDQARRGQSGTTSALAASLYGQEAAMDRGAEASQQAALQAIRDRQSALSQSAQLGGQINQSEMAQSNRNADLINSYNQRFAQNYQNYLQSSADSQNKAQMFNIGASQSAADRNVGARNAAQEEAIRRQNAAAMDKYNVGRQQIQDRLGVAEGKNRVLQNMYNNEYQKTAGKAGFQAQGLGYMRQDARDKNQQIQSAQDTGLSTLKWGADKGYFDEEEEAKK